MLCSALVTVWSVQSEVLTCLLRLPLTDQPAAQTGRSPPTSRLAVLERRKEKKRLGKVSSTHRRASIQVDDVMLARDMAEGEAVVNAHTRAKLQTAAVTDLFQLFFTLIKQPSNAAWHKRYQALMPTIMKGMEKSTHHLHTSRCTALLAHSIDRLTVCRLCIRVTRPARLSVGSLLC